MSWLCPTVHSTHNSVVDSGSFPVSKKKNHSFTALYSTPASSSSSSSSYSSSSRHPMVTNVVLDERPCWANEDPEASPPRGIYKAPFPRVRISVRYVSVSIFFACPYLIPLRVRTYFLCVSVATSVAFPYVLFLRVPSYLRYVFVCIFFMYPYLRPLRSRTYSFCVSVSTSVACP